MRIKATATMKKIIKAAKHITDGFLTITLSTDGHAGKAFFSVTGKTMNSCGCLHENILKSRPDLQPLVDLHLSDLDGVPTYAEENGFFWLAAAAGIEQKYGPEQSPETCFKYFCNHVRQGEYYVETLIAEIKEAYQKGKDSIATSDVITPYARAAQRIAGVAFAKKAWSEEMQKLLPQWKRDAEHGLALIESIE